MRPPPVERYLLILLRVGELHAARPAPLPMRIAETEASLLLNGRLFNDLLCNTNYFRSSRLAALYTGGQGWLVSQLHALISFATRCADSIAPCIYPSHRDVCSPAKKIRPSLRALTGIQFSSPGPNDVRPPRCHGSSLQLFTRAASNCSRARGNTISGSAIVCCTRVCTSIVSSCAAFSPMTYDSRRPRSSGDSGPSAQNLSDTRSVFANPLSPFAFQNCFRIWRNILSTGKYCSSRITRCFSADNLASANRFLATENGSADTT